MRIADSEWRMVKLISDRRFLISGFWALVFAHRFLCALCVFLLKPISDLRLLTSALCALLLVLSVPAPAQQSKKVARLGFLSPSTASLARPLIETFRQAMQELGYIEGENVIIEYRYGNGNPARYPELAAELVSLRPDLIVTSSTPAIFAVKNATQTIPIVMVASADPVGAGLVGSLARPGGNITGQAMLSTPLGGKRLELLKEIIPSIDRVALLWNSANRSNEAVWNESQDAASALRLKLQSLEIRQYEDFDMIFDAARKEKVQGLAVLRDPLVNRGLRRIVEFTANTRIPAIYEAIEVMDAGGLIFFGADHFRLYRRAATYVDKILKGAKPANIPVEQPTKFELVINLKTAKEIGLTIPPNVLARADRVIK
jgi:putative ABC transport system substrate-binding protein